jgi:elongation factor P
MDNETFEQISIDHKIFGLAMPFLTDNMIVKIEFYEQDPLSVTLPQTIICEIAETAPIIKGAAVSASYKPAILTNNVKVMVPTYLVVGEKIIIKTEDFSFVERAK